MHGKILYLQNPCRALSRLQPSATGHRLFFTMKMTLLLCSLTFLGLGGGDSNTPQGEVVLTSLSNPVYPQLAKAARVAGDVELNLNVRANGTVESADVISGPINGEAGCIGQRAPIAI